MGDWPSLIAANISAEQFIGMSGSGFALGLAIASYEWMAAITLIIVGKYFLPIFIEKNYTPFGLSSVFLSIENDLGYLWISLYIFVNLASVMYLGGLALETIIGIDLVYAVLGLALQPRIHFMGIDSSGMDRHNSGGFSRIGRP